MVYPLAKIHLREERIIYETVLVVNPKRKVRDETADRGRIVYFQFQGELDGIFFRPVQVKIIKAKGHLSCGTEPGRKFEPVHESVDHAFGIRGRTTSQDEPDITSIKQFPDQFPEAIGGFG